MNNFFSELKRRNVVRVGIAYVVVSWVILQFVDIIQEIVRFPGWFPQMVLALLIIGLPIALIFSWAYEVTPEGVKKTEEVDQSKSIAHGTGQKINKLIAVGFVLALGFIAYDKMVDPTPGGGDGEVVREASIAVLPFTDLSAAGDQEYFGDGIAEEILNVLAKIPDLKVTGRTSSFQFKGQNPDLRLVGQKLNVAHILEGSIRKDGNRIRITVQLISADDGFHLWSETYDRELVDIFEIQDQISQAVAAALKIQLVGGAEYYFNQETFNPEAYSLYLRGRELVRERGGENLTNAVTLFKAAVYLDPEFVSAWSALARSLSLLPGYSRETIDSLRIGREAVAAADRALALEPNNAEAYSAKGYALAKVLWDFPEGGKATLRAAELAPNDAEIANFVGDYFKTVMDLESALYWETKALELDPLFEVNYRDLASIYELMGDIQTAIKLDRQGLALDEKNMFSITNLIWHLIFAGENVEAREYLEKLKKVPGVFPAMVVGFSFDLAYREGRHEEAMEYLAEMERLYIEGKEFPSFLFIRYLDMQDFDKAAYWFEVAYKSRDPSLTFAIVGLSLEMFSENPAMVAALDKPEFNILFEIVRRNLEKNAAWMAKVE